VEGVGGNGQRGKGEVDCVGATKKKTTPNHTVWGGKLGGGLWASIGKVTKLVKHRGKKAKKTPLKKGTAVASYARHKGGRGAVIQTDREKKV